MDKHDTLLVACGTPESRRNLRDALGERYNLLEAVNTQQMLLLLNQNLNCIAAIVLDITVPEKLDRTLLNAKGNLKLLDQVPVIVITPDDSPSVVNTTFSYGAADVIPADYNPYAMLRRIENIVELHLHKQYLQTKVEEQADLLRQSNDTMVDALSSIIEYRSVESGQHILRIRHFTKLLLEDVARCCPEYQLNGRVIAIISSAAALHDIGKIAIPDSILMKPGKLTQEEMEVMKTHAITGCRILDTVSNVGDQEYLRYAYNICHYHHERWDGKGYPEGLKGDEIPICAQVVGLADVYDALTTRRVYKEAFGFDKAVNMILRGECGAFSPKLLECFKHVTEAYEALATAYADGANPKAESFDVTLPPPSSAKQEDSMERIQAKYQALVHYINVFLMEVDFTQGLFHIIYNPYLEFAQVQEMNTFGDLERFIVDELAAVEEKERMREFLNDGIQNFLDEDLRRVSCQFRLRSRTAPEGENFEITLLRINPVDTDRRSLAVLCRRIEEGGAVIARKAEPLQVSSTFRCLNDECFTLVELSPEIHLLAGYTREELRSCFENQLLELVLPEEREQMRGEFRRQLSRGSSVDVEYRVRRKDGRVRWIRDRASLSIGLDGREYLDCLLADVTESKRAYDELNAKLKRYEIILSQTENVLFEWDYTRDTITFSDTSKDIFGFTSIDANARQNFMEGSYLHPDDLPLLVDCINRLESGSPYEMVEVRISGAHGRYLWCRFRATAIRDKMGNLAKVAGVIINIDTEKQAERVLQDRADRDALTKLLNKKAAQKQAEEYLNRFPQGVDCALLIIDLDNFKQVNDQYGHLFGDAVLTKAAREIEKLFRAQDIVARIGGDEFLVLMRGVSDRNLLEIRCRRLREACKGAFQNGRQKLPLSCSIGIALAPEHGTTYYELFARADQALYRAKAKGKNDFVFYDGKSELFRNQQMSKTALNKRIDSDEEPGLAEDNIVRYAFQRLYSSKNVEMSINDILELIGKQMNVSRVYVFENSQDNRYCSNTYEWCNEGIEPQIGNLQDISYETDIPGYENNFNEQGIFYCPDISILPKPTYDIVAPQGIKSMLHCAIRDNGVFRGYIGFDECVEQRLWTKEQIQMLSYFSEMLSLFLLKQREQEIAQRQAKELGSILDNQNAWIYIIDPDNCQLKYLNAKTRKLAPGARPGMCCYKALMGREERCAGCPGLNIRKNRNDRALLDNPQFRMEVLAEATLIQWNGEESCLLTCRKPLRVGEDFE